MAGASKRTRPKSKPKLGGSMVAQANFAFEELSRLEHLRTRCEMKRELSEHEEDHPYAVADEDGPVLSYKDYLVRLDEILARLEYITAPGAWEVAQRRMEKRRAE